jgi:hypothetical protein
MGHINIIVQVVKITFFLIMDYVQKHVIPINMFITTIILNFALLVTLVGKYHFNIFFYQLFKLDFN